MFVFDCASLPQRSAVQTMLTIPEIPVPARVHIFDWGRSELNTEDSHALLSQAEQADRQKFWRLYRVALAKLLYNCCSLYVARFWKPVASITFRIWDKDAFTDDDFIGAADLSLVELHNLCQAMASCDAETRRERLKERLLTNGPLSAPLRGAMRAARERERAALLNGGGLSA